MRVYFEQSLESSRALLEQAFASYDLDVFPCFVDEVDRTERLFAAPVRFGQLIDYIHKKTIKGQAEEEMLILGTASLDLMHGMFMPESGSDAVRLTDKECDILKILYAAGGEVVERERLLRDVWGYAQGVETHTVETHIYRLRQKIEDDPAQPRLVVTKGAGYILQS